MSRGKLFGITFGAQTREFLRGRLDRVSGRSVEAPVRVGAEKYWTWSRSVSAPRGDGR